MSASLRSPEEATSATIRGAALLIVWHAAAIAPSNNPARCGVPVDEHIQVSGNTCELLSLVIV